MLFPWVIAFRFNTQLSTGCWAASEFVIQSTGELWARLKDQNGDFNQFNASRDRARARTTRKQSAGTKEAGRRRIWMLTKTACLGRNPLTNAALSSQAHPRRARFAAVVLSPCWRPRTLEKKVFGRSTFWRVELTTSKVLTWGAPANIFFRISNTSG